MTPPHWTECRAELAERLGTVPRLLVATDFDGTLAPICPRPEDVRMPKDSWTSLAALADHPGVRVAVLSGRELSEVARLVDLPKAVFAGNHGMEIKGGGIAYVHPQALACRPALDAAAHLLENHLTGVEGAFVEHKGLSLSMHYRLVAENGLAQVEQAARSCTAAFPTLKRHGGKKVIEFRPDIAWNKGYALKRLLKGLGLPAAATLYMGDDATDEDAFAVLNGVGTSLHVGANTETLARFSLRDPADTAEFLAWLRDLRVV
ncbi:MAG: Trehalose-6-phosphate phosphatase [Verrucomicrobiales bacterium]|nr:Trehalose-6-phosphate phosphatase [Verrucomicrobiales bacterium]